ncbi:MAG: hypothetical protein D3910_06995 [Candidatus Electrothrix sp. ATG2]|nr:hypothetical protein [Candidatus Electrothrix sp. ATG2]
MKIVETWKGLTAQEIIDRRDGETNGGHNMTGEIVWQYRTDYLSGGTFDDQGPCACSADRADCITVECSGGILARLDL